VAVDYFLKIEGIEGESKDAKHKNEIELESFSWGETNSGAAGRGAGAGAGAGKVSMQDLVVMTRTSKASPQLLLACASGQHFKSATLTVRKAGKDQQEFLVYKLSDVRVSSYQTGGSAGSDSPNDSAALNFAKIEVEYRAQSATGKLEPPVKSGWDVKANKKV
jgi:type VI secretion system secreted protein Hcp